MSESKEDKPKPAQGSSVPPQQSATVKPARSGIRTPPQPQAPQVRVCALIPVYDQPAKLEGVVAQLRQLSLPVILVDDGSHEPTKSLCDRPAAPFVKVIHHPVNQGKGAAVMTGFKAASRLGYTHVLQVDADGQIDLAVLPTLLRLMQKYPASLICGYPKYDASVPKSRLWGRKLTNFWCAVNSLSLSIEDAMCGLRIYPVAAALDVCENARLGRRMDFDPEILVRLLWAGVRLKYVPVAVTYPADGVSHFRPFGDNMRISWMHAKLFLQMITRFPIIIWSRAFGRDPVCRREGVPKPGVQKPQEAKPARPGRPPLVDPERARRATHAAQAAQEAAERVRLAATGNAAQASPRKADDRPSS
ncbi:glycosyltransferase family 2 protein [Sutterella seckii]|uniref:Glycosyltransferase family 2 protein n=1 Tax=Sutterella seckii TaxID=1944635 RepID=A0AAI9WMM2_9BURK|nr:glycosyltransferase family 2 protein [Sutterella seckii]KAB7650392.1 glycosyltransferase family 2 protein [Sutterella seckii]